jgi:hypothetical protein
MQNMMQGQMHSQQPLYPNRQGYDLPDIKNQVDFLDFANPVGSESTVRPYINQPGHAVRPPQVLPRMFPPVFSRGSAVPTRSVATPPNMASRVFATPGGAASQMHSAPAYLAQFQRVPVSSPLGTRMSGVVNRKPNLAPILRPHPTQGAPGRHPGIPMPNKMRPLQGFGDDSAPTDSSALSSIPPWASYAVGGLIAGAALAMFLGAMNIDVKQKLGL